MADQGPADGAGSRQVLGSPSGAPPLHEPAHALPSPSPLRGGRGALILAALALAAPAAAQQAPLLREPLGLDANYTTVMLTVDLPPNARQPATTTGTMGHRHPGSTYAYVTKGEVVNRLGDAQEKRFKAGQAWSETPGQAHYIVNASASEPAQLVVVMVIPKAATAITEPLPH